MRTSTLSILFLLLASLTTRADGPADNDPAKVRRVPKLGVEVPAEDRRKIEQGLAEFDKHIARLRDRKDPRVAALLPDVLIFHKAVQDALKYQEFFDSKEIPVALALLQEGQQRAISLAEGLAPWTTARGLVVRGYVSKIDGSVQPYGLVVPESYTEQTAGRYRLDVWLHGRGETLSELSFLHQRRAQIGPIAPRDTIVLHPYGRYCNANKFAGEIDVLEALDSVRACYRVDDERTLVRGFSMGGAGCWQLAVHYPDRWCAANPGAGFSETPLFLQSFQQETLSPTWFERKLWNWYDCPAWVLNLTTCSTVAYSGELDIQKQAADVMAEAMEKSFQQLTHIIGPQTKHSIEPKAAAHIENLLASIAQEGRQRLPRQVLLQTQSLRYNRNNWVTIDGLEEHWTGSSVQAAIDLPKSTSPYVPRVSVNTVRVTDLTLHMPAGLCPFNPLEPVEIVLSDEQGRELAGPKPSSDRSWKAQLHKVDGKWVLGPRPAADRLRKSPGLQGPIDDAFLDSFLFVRPTGKARHEKVGKWAAAEFERAVEHWRRHFRGEPRVKDDKDVTPEDMAAHHVVLWGDPASNELLGKIAEKLPIKWTAEQIEVGANKYAADHHAPILIHPNPQSPQRYVVLNSGFTFRDFAYLNNARQVPMLPDWAIVDLDTPPGNVWPGKIVAADFFDEAWKLKPGVRGKSVAQAENGEVLCHARDVTTHGEKVQYEPKPEKNTVGFWVNAREWIHWDFSTHRDGKYKVEILQGCGKGEGGSEVRLSIGVQDLKFSVEDTGHFQNFVPREIGEVTLPAGSHQIVVRPLRKAGIAVMDLRQIRLIPVASKE